MNHFSLPRTATATMPPPQPEVADYFARCGTKITSTGTATSSSGGCGTPCMMFDAMVRSGSSSSTTTTTTKRKRVRFEEDLETKAIKRRIVDVPSMPSYSLSESERATLWMQKSDYEITLTAALNDVVAAKTGSGSGSLPFPSLGDLGDNSGSTTGAEGEDTNAFSISSYYANAMAQTYMKCCSPEAGGTIALENLALLSLLDSSFRGLENYTLPREMRMDRKIRKAKTVSRVLELQGELKVAGNPKEDATECLRLVSEYFSEPSRKFARALGEIDGTFVHLEWSSTLSSSSLSSSSSASSLS